MQDIMAHIPTIRQYLDATDPSALTAPAVYTHGTGTEYRTLVREVLMHAITHGHYHRGQMAKAVRWQGHEPISTGFILYTRQREAIER